MKKRVKFNHRRVHHISSVQPFKNLYYYLFKMFYNRDKDFRKLFKGEALFYLTNNVRKCRVIFLS